jgi:NAD-dependent SIR2 family protein deacetylase
MFFFTAIMSINTKYIRSPNENGSEIAVTDLPSCRQCRSLVRPHVVWFNEALWPDVLEKINEEIGQCDLFLVVCLPFFLFDSSL